MIPQFKVIRLQLRLGEAGGIGGGFQPPPSFGLHLILIVPENQEYVVLHVIFRREPGFQAPCIRPGVRIRQAADFRFHRFIADYPGIVMHFHRLSAVGFRFVRVQGGRHGRGDAVGIEGVKLFPHGGHGRRVGVAFKAFQHNFAGGFFRSLRRRRQGAGGKAAEKAEGQRDR